MLSLQCEALRDSNGLEWPPASLSSFPVPATEAMRDNKLHATLAAVDDAVAQLD